MPSEETETVDIDGMETVDLSEPTHTEFEVSADTATILAQQLGGIAGAYYAEDKLFVPNELADAIVAALDGLPAIVLAAAKATAIASLTDACAAAIVSGYKSAALGEVHAYPSKVTDQINMMGSVTASLLPDLPEDWLTPFWCQDGEGEWAFRPHSAEAIQQAGADGKQHILDCQAHLAELSTLVTLAATVEAVDAIEWEAV
jgi:hypothetical protein